MPRCIYCLEDKPPAAFSGREHVIPQAFGTFDTDNLVLRCVCDDCNKHFGRTIDLKLARDSLEGIDRFRAGVRPAAEFKSMGGRSTTYVEVSGGSLAGAKGYHVADATNTGRLGIVAFPQIGFARSEDGPYEWFLLDKLPTKDELVAKGYVVGTMLHIKMPELSLDEGLALLRAKGFNVDTLDKSGSLPTLTGTVRVEVVGKISEPENRAMTKISLNYLARMLGEDVALRPEFDNARSFARYGRERAKVRVRACENPWQTRSGHEAHYIGLSKDEDLIVAQLFLLGRTQFFVVLAEGVEDASWFRETAHSFDVTARRIEPMHPLPLLRGPLLKRIPS